MSDFHEWWAAQQAAGQEEENVVKLDY